MEFSGDPEAMKTMNGNVIGEKIPLGTHLDRKPPSIANA